MAEVYEFVVHNWYWGVIADVALFVVCVAWLKARAARRHARED